MSGFFGILRFDGKPIELPFLENVSAQMSFRGPDGTNAWCESSIGSCFALMRTGPVEQAPQQPVRYGERYLLWGDVRLDGRRELLEELSAENCASQACVTSEELLLRAWATWGAASLDRVIGDFSFSLWDAQEKTLWCARDFVGARPFYYAQVGAVFCFSNTLQILRLVQEISTELDELFIGDFLLEGWNVDHFRTVYRDIRRLPAGHLLKLSKGTSEVRRFRKLPIEEPLSLKRPEEYLEIYRDLLKSAVSDRLPNGATALYLSGGLDSASVCAVANQIAPERGRSGALRAFTLSWRSFFDDPEPVFANVTAQYLGIAHETLPREEFTPYEYVETREGSAPEPIDQMFFVSDRRILQKIAAHSRIILSGDGGDNVLAGQSWPYLTHLWRRKEWGEITRSFGGYLWSQKTVPPLRGGFRTRLRQLFASRDPFADYPPWLNPSFEARANLKQRWLELREAPGTEAAEHALHPRGYESLHNGYWAAVLEMEDAGWNRVLLESRAPLLDVRVLEFLLCLPPVPWCMNKLLCRRAMTNLLPEEVLNRPKTPLVVDPVEECLKTGEWMQALLNASPKWIEAFVNWPKWCETSQLSQGSPKATNLRPASLFHWLKAVESE